jgi:hypothetical protein
VIHIAKESTVLITIKDKLGQAEAESVGCRARAAIAAVLGHSPISRIGRAALLVAVTGVLLAPVASANQNNGPSGFPPGHSGTAGDRAPVPTGPERRDVFQPPSSLDEEDEQAAATISNTYSPNYMYNQHNGRVQTKPRIYLILWGNWSSSNDRYNVQNRLYYFYRGLGGSRWAAVMTQYRQGCTAGTWNCTGAYAGNPSGNFKNWWKDNSAVPLTPTKNQIAAEATRGAAHFGDYSYNAQYIVALPPRHGDTLFVAKGGTSCAWHSWTSAGGTWITYTSLPYQPDSSRCYMNYVNVGSAGVLDGVTIVAGHEYAETVTDPGTNAWMDVNGIAGENGDKCSTYTGAAPLSTGTFPVQATWSNYHRYYYGSGCVFTW